VNNIFVLFDELKSGTTGAHWGVGCLHLVYIIWKSQQ